MNKQRRKSGERLKIVESKEFKAYIDQAVVHINNGWKTGEIFADIITQWPEHNEWFHQKLMSEAYKRIRNTLHRDREYIFQLHMNRYEDLYKQTMIMEDFFHRPLEPRRDYEVIKFKLTTAMKILKQKEDLVGLHNKDVVIEIENNNTTVISDKPGGIKLANLTLEERIELLGYLKQTRTVPIEGERQVLIKKKVSGEMQTIQAVAVDTEFDELPEKVVDKIKTDYGKKKIHYIEAPLVEDLVDRSKPNRTLKDVTESIDEGIKKKFEKLMKRKVEK